MSNLRRLPFVAALLAGSVCPCVAGLLPSNVAVVVNTRDASSMAVGQYYCAKTGVPAGHIIGVDVLVNDWIYLSDYHTLASQIRTGLLALGSGTTNAAGDPIQCLVMCYGVPYIINGDPSGLTTEPTSVDSYLTLLFNSNPDLGPDQIDGDTNYGPWWDDHDPLYCKGPHGVVNPYCWRTPYSAQLHPARDFASFRASPTHRN